MFIEQVPILIQIQQILVQTSSKPQIEIFLLSSTPYTDSTENKKQRESEKHGSLRSCNL